MTDNKTPKNDKLNVVVTIILCIVFIPTILINAAMITKTFAKPDHLPDIFGVKPVIVLSGSMSPTFDAKALIFVKETDTSELKAGDIICYLTEGTAITHRIEQVVLENGQTRYITRGDANNTPDRLAVAPEQVEGVYIGQIPKLGGMGMFLQSTTGMIHFIVLPILIYFIWEIARRAKEAKKQKSREDALKAEIESLKATKQETAEIACAKEDVTMK